MRNGLDKLGRQTLDLLQKIGEAFSLFLQAFRWTFTRPIYFRNIIQQMEAIGVQSIPVVLITSLSTGLVLALQSHTGFKRFHAENLVGTVVALSLTRELGPVLTGLIVAGRAGAAMAAELGTMRVTEQIDALSTLAVNPVKFLIIPRLIAGLIMLPILTIFADMIGIIGGYFISVEYLEANPVIYVRRTTEFLEGTDVYGGLLKACVFGILISIVCSYKGFTTDGGAVGVGKATTGAVVISMILILVTDYFLTTLLF